MNRLLILFFLVFVTSLLAQEPMRVTRSAAIDRNIPIHNIYIDEDNNKWVGNNKGVFQVHSVDYASEVEISDDELSLLSYKGGNYNLKYNRSTLLQILKDQTDGLFEGERDFAGAFYDPNKKELWIGTKGIGVFRIKVEPEIQFVEHIDMSNSKLRTDYITTMYSDKPGSYWIGTEEGVLHNKGDKWSLYEKYVRIEAIEKSGTDIWVFGDGWLWRVDANGDWNEIELDPSLVEGKINDIALDSKGNMWIASEVITRFNMESGDFNKYGAAEYFTSNVATSLAVDKDNAVWVGTEDKGLYLIEKESAITVNCLVEKELGCDDKNDAELRVIVSGGEEPYSYKWEAGLEGDNPKGLGPGTYAVTVTDKKGKKKNLKVTIDDPGLTLDVKMDQVESAEAALDGAATVSVNGGQSDYTFLWDNGETGKTAIKLNEGQHSVTVTDQKGCSAVASVKISRQLGALSVAFSQTSENKCFGDKTAALSIEISGGLGPYLTAWSRSDLQGDQLANLAAGTYQVTVTDAQNNTTVGEVVVAEPEQMAAVITIEAPASTNNADGKATAKVTGGTGPYSFIWDNGEALATAYGLAAGIRNLTITDAVGCQTTATVAIDENILPLSVSIDQTAEITCFGGNTASVEVKVIGGKGPFEYQWNEATLSGKQASSLFAGEYVLTLTDAEGTTIVETIKINEPEALLANIIVEAPASTGNSDGKATAKAAGGTAPYTFKWDTGETEATAIKLGPGERNLIVTDASGCTVTATVLIDENILPLSVSIDQTAEINCFGGNTASVEVKAIGGKGPFEYQWNKAELSGKQASNLLAGEYILTLTDGEGTTTVGTIKINEPTALSANIIVEAPASTDNADGKATAKVTGGTAPYTFKWDTGETDATAAKLGPGERNLIVTDAAGCTATATVLIDENILPLSVSIDQTAEINCFGGNTASVEVKSIGGKGPFEYQWNKAELSGKQALNLLAGEYILTLTDAEGTTTVGTIKINEPAALSANIIVEAPASTDNADGKASTTVTGGTAPYTFKWDNGETEATATKLGPGERNLIVTDASGCTATATVLIDENILPLSVSIDQTAKINCFGGNTASIEVKVIGGKGPFEYQWNEATLSGKQASSLLAGEYVLTLTDAEGTTTVGTIKINEPAALSANIIVEAPASTDNSDGKATAKVTGGTAPYTYKWDTGETDATAIKLGPGERNLIVTDASGCTANATVLIDENILPLSVSIDQTAEIKCFGDKTAALEVKVIGGKGPFKYQWSAGGLNGNQVSNLKAGEYLLTVTDAVGSSITSEITVVEPIALTAAISRKSPASNENSNDGIAEIEAKGGSGAYNFQWDNNEESGKASQLGIGSHQVTVIDGNGCSISLSFETKKRILPELTVANLREGQTVKMEELYFEADSFRITDISLPVIEELYDFMKQNNSVVIEVGGHTNNIPEHAFCDALSKARAKSVADYIVQMGIDPKRVYYKGYGKRNPIATNTTSEGRAKNQRVEIKIISI